MISSEMLRMVTRKYIRKIPRLRRLRDAQRFWEMVKGSVIFLVRQFIVMAIKVFLWEY